MDESLERADYTDREQQPKNRRKVRATLILSGAFVLLVGLLAGGVVFWKARHNTALSSAVVRSVNFPLYYPLPLPAGYAYEKNSAKNEGDIIFFVIRNGSKTINISEQTIPAHPPDLDHLTGFTSLNTLAGNAAIGSNRGQPIAIVMSNTTLITVSGYHTIPNDIVANVAKNLTSLTQ